jgi:hypothetical protein
MCRLRHSMYSNACIQINTVNDRKPDRPVFKWSFSERFLGLVFERSAILLTFENRTKIARFLNDPASLDRFNIFYV